MTVKRESKPQVCFCLAGPTACTMLHNPLFRWGIGASGAVMIAAVSYFFLTGLTQLIAYGMAVMDLVFTPLFLKYAAEG